MKHFTISAAALGSLAVITLGLAGPALALPTEDPSPMDIQGTSAADTISSLEGQGYTVQLNGSVTSALQDCKVTGVEGLVTGPVDPDQVNTVYVDISCPTARLND